MFTRLANNLTGRTRTGVLEYFGGEIMPGEFGDAEFEVDGIPSPITPFMDGRHCTDFLVGIYRRSRPITGDIMR